jgi:hypothetical protein
MFHFIEGEYKIEVYKAIEKRRKIRVFKKSAGRSFKGKMAELPKDDLL